MPQKYRFVRSKMMNHDLEDGFEVFIFFFKLNKLTWNFIIVLRSLYSLRYLSMARIKVKTDKQPWQILPHHQSTHLRGPESASIEVPNFRPHWSTQMHIYYSSIERLLPLLLGIFGDIWVTNTSQFLTRHTTKKNFKLKCEEKTKKLSILMHMQWAMLQISYSLGLSKMKVSPKTNRFSRNFPEIRLRLKVNYQLDKEN